MQHSIPSAVAEPGRILQARYGYYRRCQVFRHNGEQCKAPAEKGLHICYAHAGQQAMAFRRDLERRVVLAEAVAEMRRQGHTKCELENLLTDFKGIQVTLAVMARAIIAGRIDCKTAGRLVVHLQMMSKLLWTLHKNKTLPRINIDNSDLEDVAKNNPALSDVEDARKERARKTETSEVMTSPETERRQLTVAYDRLRHAGHDEYSQSAVRVKGRMFLEGHRNWRDGPSPCQQTRAA
jgi:hypothetical protein